MVSGIFTLQMARIHANKAELLAGCLRCVPVVSLRRRRLWRGMCSLPFCLPSFGRPSGCEAWLRRLHLNAFS